MNQSFKSPCCLHHHKR